jgi:hypothetical protein
LAVEVNEVALGGVVSADATATRRTLLAVIRNLATAEAGSSSMSRRRTGTRRASALSAKPE